MTCDSQTPYDNLTPDLILDAVESIDFVCSGNLLALNSYENRVYQVGIEDAPPLITKFYRPKRWSDESILEEHQFSEELVNHEIPVVAPLADASGKTLHHFKNFRFALFRRWGGRALEIGRLDQLEWMGRFIGRFHAISACRAFQHRPILTVETQAIQPYHFLTKHDFIPAYLKENYDAVIKALCEKMMMRFEEAGAIPPIRLHGDLHAGNILWNDDEGPHIVDLDDCCMGPAIQDLWMLLAGDENQVQLQLEYLLRGYRAFHDFNFSELSLIESLRTLRMIQYSGWLATRWQDPAFPRHFPWFNTPHYWQEQLHQLQGQLQVV